MSLLQQRCTTQHLTREALPQHTGVPPTTIAKIDDGTIRAGGLFLRRRQRHDERHTIGYTAPSIVR